MCDSGLEPRQEKTLLKRHYCDSWKILNMDCILKIVYVDD